MPNTRGKIFHLLENLPESSHPSPHSAEEAQVSWESQDESFNEVTYVTASSSYLQADDDNKKDIKPHHFIINHGSSEPQEVHYQSSPIYVHVAEVVGSSDGYEPVELQSYSVSEGKQYGKSSVDNGDEREQYKYHPPEEAGHSAHSSHSPESSIDMKPVSPNAHKSTILLQNAVLDSQEIDTTDQELANVSVEQPVILTNSSSIVGQSVSSLGMPIVLDRNNLAAFIATSRADSTLVLSSQPRSLLHSDDSPYLTSSSSSVTLAQTILSPILSQRDILPAIISSTSSHGTHFPINHKQMLAQKYAAELDSPSTSNAMSNEMRTHILRLPIERLNERVSSPYSVSSSATNLTNSQAASMYITHTTSSHMPQDLPIDVYSMDRGVALVSSTRDSPDDLMEHYVSPLNHTSSHSGVHSYVSSSVDLVPSTVDHNLPSNVDSTVGSKLHDQEEIIDSSDSYGDHVDTSEGVLHSTTQVSGYSQQLDDLGSSQDGATSTVASVLGGATAVDSADHVYNESADLTDLDNLQCCGTDSSTHPDSTRLSLMSRSDLIVLPSSSHQVDSMRPRRDLRNKHWCEDCCHFYDKECSRHKIQLIFDKPVLSRAWASLPATYLYVNRITACSSNGNSSKKPDTAVYGVFAKKTIPKRTQFGPVEGVLVKQADLPADAFLLMVDKEDDMFVMLDTEDELISNWMRFVRPAKTFKEQNLVLVQQGQCLYFNTTRAVNPKTELRVWYSSAYAEKWKLNLLEPDDNERRAMEDEENAWPCFECNKRFLTSEDLQKHLNQHDEEEFSLSKIGSARLRSKSRKRPQKRNRAKHSKLKKLSTKQEEYQCEICQKVFPRNYSLQRHLIMHSGEKKYKCPICDMKFSHVYNRNRHVRRHRQSTDNDQVMARSIKSLFRRIQGTDWPCVHCHLSFNSFEILNLHALTHGDETNLDGTSHKGDDVPGQLYDVETYKCPQCANVFSVKDELIEHVAIHGKALDKNRHSRGILNPLKPFKCNLCYKSFATNDRLIRHYLVHGSEDSKPLQCPTCYKRFLNNSALACHIKIHSEERKYYECPICKQEFHHIVTLKEHVHSHCDRGIYTCPQCLKTFEEYNQIRKHIRAFHSERRYPCEKCDKIFPRPDKLKLHMLRHSDHREFLCANCGKQFKRKDKLKEHMKRMHAPEREARLKASKPTTSKKFVPKVSPTDYHRFIYKCHSCLLGFKRRGMLVNHLAKRHPEIRPDSVPELNLPILKTTRDYYCQYCEKVYKSSSKRKAHILKNHPGAELPMSNRRKGGVPEIPGIPNPTFSETVGSITTHPHHCDWCHKQYASKAKLLQHQRKKHTEMIELTLAITKDQVRSRTHVHLSTATTTLATGPVVIAHTVPGTVTPDGSVVIDATKRKLQLVDQDSLTPVIVTSNSENLPSADLLTQAMSELTQTLSEYRTSSGEFITARISHSNIHISPSASTCPSPEQNSSSNAPSVVVPATAGDSDSDNDGTDGALDQSQLRQLLAHYQQQPLSPQSLASAVTTTTFASRSWPVAVTTLSNYPAR